MGVMEVEGQWRRPGSRGVRRSRWEPRVETQAPKLLALLAPRPALFSHAPARKATSLSDLGHSTDVAPHVTNAWLAGSHPDCCSTSLRAQVS